VRKSGLIAGSAIVAVAAIGLSVGWFVKHRRKPISPQPVAVTTVFEGPEVTLTGAIEPQSIEQIAAPMAGILDAWFVDVGAEVYEDQLVGRIRNADLDVALQNAQTAADRAEKKASAIDAQIISAKLEVSRTDADQVRAHNELDRVEKIYQRYKLLMDADAIARLTFEKTEAEYKSAKTEAANRDRASKEAQDKAAALDHDSADAKHAFADLNTTLEKAKEAIAECDLHSPADGVVLTRDIHQADKVEEKQNVMTVATDLTKLAVILTPDPRVLARIHAAQHAFVSISGGEVPGEVHEVRGTDVIVWFMATQAVTKLGTGAQVRIVF